MMVRTTIGVDAGLCNTVVLAVVVTGGAAVVVGGTTRAALVLRLVLLVVVPMALVVVLVVPTLMLTMTVVLLMLAAVGVVVLAPTSTLAVELDLEVVPFMALMLAPPALAVALVLVEDPTVVLGMSVLELLLVVAPLTLLMLVTLAAGTAAAPVWAVKVNGSTVVPVWLELRLMAVTLLVASVDMLPYLPVSPLPVSHYWQDPLAPPRPPLPQTTAPAAKSSPSNHHDPITQG